MDENVRGRFLLLLGGDIKSGSPEEALAIKHLGQLRSLAEGLSVAGGIVLAPPPFLPTSMARLDAGDDWNQWIDSYYSPAQVSYWKERPLEFWRETQQRLDSGDLDGIVVVAARYSPEVQLGLKSVLEAVSPRRVLYLTLQSEDIHASNWPSVFDHARVFQRLRKMSDELIRERAHPFPYVLEEPASAPAYSDADEVQAYGEPSAPAYAPPSSDTGGALGPPPGAAPPPAADTAKPPARKWRGREPSPPASAPPSAAPPLPTAPQAPPASYPSLNQSSPSGAANSMRCTRCGTSQPVGAKFCGRCGASLGGAALGLTSGEALSMEPPPVMTDVRMGVSTPTDVSPGDGFVARFAAYTAMFKDEVQRILKEEAPDSPSRLDLETSQWQKGARVSVRLAADQVQIANPDQEFVWSGEKQILRFDCKVLPDARGKTLILKFDIAVERFPLIALRPEIRLSSQPQAAAAAPEAMIEKRLPRSAFASYASEDRGEVLSRIRSLEIATGINVFVDNLSIRPGDQWKATLDNEIRAREVFWLFWSRHAQKSPWVDWEWRTALAEKSLAAIQPHPLEPADLAPPPKELSDLQFGAMYEWYITKLREP